MGIIQASNLVRLFNMRQIGEIVFYGFPDNLLVDTMGIGKIPTIDIYYGKAGDFGVSVFTTMIRQQYIDSLLNRERNMLYSSILYTMKLINSKFLLTIDSISSRDTEEKTYLIVNSRKIVERFNDRSDYILIRHRRIRSSLTLPVAMTRFENILAAQILMSIRGLTEDNVNAGFQKLVNFIKEALTLIGEDLSRN
ncbi:MAG: hypothetical protein ACUVQ0_06555 [Thermoproteota archaeon]